MSLFAYLDNIPDPRAKRGVRHSIPVVLRLVVWGFACGLLTVEHICIAAKGIWVNLGPQLGTTRSYAPDATTVRRVLSEIEAEELQCAFEQWVAELIKGEEIVAAVDGKAIRNLSDGEGGVQKVLNVFAHDLKLSLSQRKIPADQGESTVLRGALIELFDRYPGLAILTGDAAYSGRDLCTAIKEAGRDYVVQVKANQKVISERLKYWFSGKPGDRAPDATLKKKRPKKSTGDLGGVRASLQADCSWVQISECATSGSGSSYLGRGWGGEE